MQKILEMTTANAEETFNLGFEFSQKLAPGSILCFRGDLGAGKTTCIKGICAGLDVSQPVTSPTFTLINEYKGRLSVYHFDFYRIKSEYETFDLGLDEYFFGDGVCLIEWPEIIDHLLPEKRIEFHLQSDFSADADVRIIKIYSS